MEMNRQYRRMAKKQKAIDDDGAPIASRRQSAPPPRSERATPAQFMREVRGELRKVYWPTRSEVSNYSLVTLVVVALVTAIIGALDFGFGEAVLKLFER